MCINRERKMINENLGILSSSGLIDEVSLLRMEIIPQSVYHKITDDSNFAGIRYDNWTSLGYWLGIYWNKAMQQAVHNLNQNGYQKQQTTMYSQQTGVKEVQVEMGSHHPVNKAEVETEAPGNDEWDEELINEIQGIFITVYIYDNSHCISLLMFY